VRYRRVCVKMPLNPNQPINLSPVTWNFSVFIKLFECMKCFKRGYTFLAEAKSASVSSGSGHWRMRLIGSANPLPVPVRSDISTSFNVLELRDYYIPNDKHIILRYVATSLEFYSHSVTFMVE